MELLEGLLSTLSQYYTVTLIAPPPPVDEASPLAASVGSRVETVAMLGQNLTSVPNFDSRRVLEYSKEEGRLALARALACDAHCEVMLEVVGGAEEEANDTSSVHDCRNGINGYSTDDQDGDGDRTPRANSPVFFEKNNQQQHDLLQQAEEKKVSLLETYHADMARIRKSSSVLIFLLLPVAFPQSRSPTTSHLTISELDVETVIRPFLLPGQSELSSRVPGVKIVDERRGEKDTGTAWSQAGKRVGLLSRGWQ
ncbi:hypothetical protein CBS101457_006611 [Exobasidium rhododendri]|nr:hypothetical protein CBS101457_006611 [Exobasidium rhododendri]